MAREVTVLGLGGDVLRGVRLDADGDSPVRGTVASWPLGAVEASAPAGDADFAAQAAEEAVAAADAETAEGGSSALAESFAGAAETFGTREFVLSLPLSMLLVKTLRLPVDARDRLAETAREALMAVSPFPDEEILVGAEVVAETDEELVAVVAALPESAAAGVSEALADAKVHVLRTDATALGWLRGLWPRICERQDVTRRLVLMDLDGGWDLVLLEDGAPAVLRGLGEVDDAAGLGREVMLSLCQRDRGADDVQEVVVCSRGALADDVLERLAVFGPVRTVTVEDEYAGVEGSALRVVEGAALDVTPATWREAHAESRFLRSMKLGLGIAAGLWLAVMAGLFSVDAVYDFRTGRVKAAGKAHERAWKAVRDTTNSVALIERYRDHAHGALEILKTVTDEMPGGEGFYLQSFSYRRGESVRLVGFSDERVSNRDFQDRLKNAAFEDSERLFAEVKSRSDDRSTKKGFKLDLECLFPGSDEDDGNGGGR